MIQLDAKAGDVCLGDARVVEGGLLCLGFTDRCAVRRSLLSLSAAIIHFIIEGKDGTAHCVDLIVVFLITGVEFHIVNLPSVVVIQLNAKAGDVRLGDARVVKGCLFRIRFTDEGAGCAGGLRSDLHAVSCGRGGFFGRGRSYGKGGILGAGGQLLLRGGDGLSFGNGCRAAGASGQRKGCKEQGGGTCV